MQQFANGNWYLYTMHIEIQTDFSHRAKLFEKLETYIIVISRKTQSVPPARKDTWLSVSFYHAIL